MAYVVELGANRTETDPSLTRAPIETAAVVGIPIHGQGLLRYGVSIGGGVIRTRTLLII